MTVFKLPSEYSEFEFIKYIQNRFPCMPEDETVNCAKKCVFNRNPANEVLPVSKYVSVMIKAHIRHNLTDYENLLFQGKSQYKARKLIDEKARKIYTKWKKQRKHHPKTFLV